MQKFKVMGFEVPFDLAKFVNENGQDDKTLEILGVLMVNIFRVSPDFKKEILGTLARDSDFIKIVVEEVKKNEVLSNGGSETGIKKDN